MTRRIVALAAKPRPPRARRSEPTGSATPAAANHFAALRRGLAFLAAIAWLTIPIALAERWANVRPSFQAQALKTEWSAKEAP
jgi:hypothetical protein